MLTVLAVPDSEMPSHHEWVLVEQGEDATAYVAESMVRRKQLAEVMRAMGCRHGLADVS